MTERDEWREMIAEAVEGALVNLAEDEWLTPVGRRVADAVLPFLAEAWDEALESVWELNDPPSSIHPEASGVVSRADVVQTKRENPFREVGK